MNIFQNTCVIEHSEKKDGFIILQFLGKMWCHDYPENIATSKNIIYIS